MALPPIEWDLGLETGDVLVDQQHRGIHSLFNALEAAEDSMQEIMRVLDTLLDHVVTHFTTEEDLMEREHYPDALVDEHVAQHRELTGSVRQKVLEFRTGQLTTTDELVEFMREWVTVHVRQHDRALIDYMRARGRSASLTTADRRSGSRPCADHRNSDTAQ